MCFTVMIMKLQFTGLALLIRFRRTLDKTVVLSATCRLRAANLATTAPSTTRRRVLQQAVEALGFSMHETTTRDDESNEILTAIQINVPPHIRVARMEIKTIYGDWSQTTDAAIQSACFNALVYLQKVKVLTIDSIHSSELKKCQRELLAVNSWTEASKDRADKLQLALSTMIKEKNPVLASPRIPTKVNLLQESVNTKNSTDGKLLALSGYSPVSDMKQKCTNEQLLTPSGSSQTTQVINSKNSTDRRLLAPSGSSSVYTMKQLSTNEELLAPSGSSQIAQDVGSKKFTDGPLLAPSGTPPECTMKQKCTNEQLSTPSGSSQITQIGASKVIPSGIPFISLTNKPFAFHPNCAKLLRGKWTRVSRLPEPIKANAAINRKKRKMIVDSTCSQEQAASLPSHPLSDGSCSENTFSAVTDLSNGAAYARPEHIDPACTSTALATPPSVNKPTTLRTRNALIECKVRKPLFQDDEDDEDKRKASELA